MMNITVPTREGVVPFRGYNVWYRIVGEGEQSGKVPLLALHGGPGVPHDYLEPLEALVATGRRVIFYDQLGCGNSDRPDDPALWTVDLFVEELETMRRALGLGQVHLFGSSWGGMLGMQYALTKPAGLISLVTAGSPASAPHCIAEMDRLRGELPAEVQQTLHAHEAAGATDDPAYEEAVQTFLRRHLCRTTPWPDCLNRAGARIGKAVYRTLWGPSEVYVTGTLKDWDISSQIAAITVPMLVTCGRHDEVTPAVNEAVHQAIEGSEFIIFEESAHLPWIDEPDRYLAVVGDFLDRVEVRAELVPPDVHRPRGVPV
jgi:proline-specific peptidase